MPELSLDDVDRHAFAGELDGVRMAQMVRREPAAHPGLGGERAELAADGGRGPRATAGWAVDDAEQRPDRELETVLEPAVQVLEPPVVHPDLTTTIALTVADQHRPAGRVHVGLGQGQRLGDPQPAAPQHRDDSPHSKAVAVLTGVAHDGDDLLDSRRV